MFLKIIALFIIIVISLNWTKAEKAIRDAKLKAAWADCLKHIVSGDPKIGAPHRFAPEYFECNGIELNKNLKNQGIEY